MAARYRGKTPCTDCMGTRLRKEAGYVKLENIATENDISKFSNIQEILLMLLEKILLVIIT